MGKRDSGEKWSKGKELGSRTSQHVTTQGLSIREQGSRKERRGAHCLCEQWVHCAVFTGTGNLRKNRRLGKRRVTFWTPTCFHHWAMFPVFAGNWCRRGPHAFSIVGGNVGHRAHSVFKKAARSDFLYFFQPLVKCYCLQSSPLVLRQRQNEDTMGFTSGNWPSWREDKHTQERLQ